MALAVFQRTRIRLGVLASVTAAAVVALCWVDAARSAPPAAIAGPVTTTIPSAEQVAFFEKDVKPILESACLKCHGGEGGKIKGGLKLTSRAAILHGGDTGPAVSLDAPAKSLILKAISYTDEELKMPPKQQLAAAQMATLTKWVEMGAPWTPGGD